MPLGTILDSLAGDPELGRAPEDAVVTSILQVIANARLALVLDGEP